MNYTYIYIYNSFNFRFAGDPRHVCSKCGEVFASTSMKSSHEDICILTAEEVKLK